MHPRGYNPVQTHPMRECTQESHPMRRQLHVESGTTAPGIPSTHPGTPRVAFRMVSRTRSGRHTGAGSLCLKLRAWRQSAAAFRVLKIAMMAEGILQPVKQGRCKLSSQ